jgi:hypothetical protein
MHRVAPALGKVNSKAVLYRHLLRIATSGRPPPIASLIYYHDMHPSYQSTQSYNLIIAHAFRRSAIGLALRQIRAWEGLGLRGNRDSRRLKIRGLLELGSWASTRAQLRSVFNGHLVSSNHEASQEEESSSSGSAASRLRIFGRQKRAMRYAMLHSPFYSLASLHTHLSVAPSPELLSDPSLFRRLVDTFREQRTLSPSAVYFIVQAFTRVGKRNSAFTLAAAYLSGLPANIDKRTRQTCLSIIHLLMTAMTAHRRDGLALLHEMRRTMMRLLVLHPRLRPSSATVALLLRGLKKARGGVAVASNLVESFKRRWGAGIEDSRIRRRITSLALKEGRMDVVDAAFRQHRVASVVAFNARTHVPASIWRSEGVYRRRGKEERLWLSLNKRRAARRREVSSFYSMKRTRACTPKDKNH